MFFLVAEIVQLHLVARFMLGNLLLQFTHLRHFLTVYLGDNITLFKVCLLGGTSIAHLADIHARHRTQFGGVALSLLGINIVANIATLHAQNSTLNSTIHLQVVHHFVHDGGRDCEAIACIRTRLAVYHRIDAHKFATLINQRTTRITCIDGGIGLNETLYAIRTQGTSLSADDTSRNGAVEVERITYGQYPLAQFQVVAIPNLDSRKSLGINLHQGEVGCFIGTDNASVELSSVVQFDIDFISLSNHMIVGNDIAVGTDNHTTTRAMSVGLFILTLLRLLTTLAKAKEIAEKVFEGVLNLHPLCLPLYRNRNIHHAINRRLGRCGQIHINARSRHGNRRRFWFGNTQVAITNHCCSNNAATQNQGSGTNPVSCFLIHFVSLFWLIKLTICAFTFHDTNLNQKFV